MNRRYFIALLRATLAADAQPPAKVYSVDILGNPLPTSPQAVPLWEAFAEGLLECGYTDGENLVIERRWAEGRLERFPSLAAELVNLKVDLILAVSTSGALAAKQATRLIPIVMVYVLNPVESGLVTSLARPGGNVTGLGFGAGLEIVGKHLELLKEGVPHVSRVAVLSDPAHPLDADFRKEAQGAARVLGLTLQVYEAQDPSELESAFAAMTKWRAGSSCCRTPSPFSMRDGSPISPKRAGCRRCTHSESLSSRGTHGLCAECP